MSWNPLVGMLAVLLGGPCVYAAAAPDFRAVRDEAVGFLSGYLRIETVNPPGNETRGAQYLRSTLEREGIPSEIFESAPGRGNLVARLKGNGRKKPVLIMGHIDVVAFRECRGHSACSRQR